MTFKRRDLTGQKFGKLTVLQKTDHKNSSGSYFWRCYCECGRETLALSRDLKSGHKKSCGCFRIERASDARKLKLKGKRFGRLLVLEETALRKKSDGKVIWRCVCECGAEVMANGSDLVQGNIVSCGCYHTEHVVPVLDEIRKSNLVENTKLDTLTSKVRKDNKNGVKGVYFNKMLNKYQAYIRVQKKRIYLGSFTTLKEATDIRLKAEEEYFKPILKKYGRGMDIPGHSDKPS